MDLCGGSGWSHVYQGSCTEYCITPLFAKVVLDGPKEIADSVWQGTHRVRFLDQNIATVFMAGRTGGINATELGLSVHSSTFLFYYICII
jgi:hypothetical protein